MVIEFILKLANETQEGSGRAALQRMVFEFNTYISRILLDLAQTLPLMEDLLFPENHCQPALFQHAPGQ